MIAPKIAIETNIGLPSPAERLEFRMFCDMEKGCPLIRHVV